MLVNFDLGARYLPNMVLISISVPHFEITEYRVEVRSQSSKIGTYRTFAEFRSELGIRILCWFSISELDNQCRPNMVLKKAQNLVTTEYGDEFWPQSSIFGTQTNVELNFDLRARYSVSIKHSAGFYFISELDIRYLPNMVLNCNLRARYSVSNW